MKKFLKVIFILLMVVSICGSIGYLFFRNRELTKAYEAATQQVTQLQAKLNAVGTFTDVYTIKTEVKMGQEIKQEDLVLQTVPTSSVPSNVVTDAKALVGNFYRIGLKPGVTLTSDFITVEEYIGSVYDRDVFLDSLPVGTKVGDYIDIRVVLPGGEEYTVFEHRRVNARYDNAVKMRFDEADLWIYTSMMVDKALYEDVGLKVYATKYVDPGSHDATKAYYPVRKEVVGVMNTNPNLTDEQKARMWNESIRQVIDSKLKAYNTSGNKDATKIASANTNEHSRFKQATAYYESLLEAVNNGTASTEELGTTSSTLVDPNTVNSSTESLGNLGDAVNNGNSSTETNNSANADGLADSQGNKSVIPQQDYLDAEDSDLFADESPIQ